MQPTRRQVMIATAAVACASCLKGAHQALAADGPMLIDAGDAAAIAEGVSDKFEKSDNVLIYRAGKTLFASTAICSHRNCAVKIVGKEIRCPCHGSRYDGEGKVTRGPATKSLVRYAVMVKEGHLWIDKSQKFDQDKWNDPKCAVELAA